jgi:putative Holliday junction resolvase
MALLETSAENLQQLPLGRIAAFDYGEKRIGVALSDPLQVLATPFRTLGNAGKKSVLRELSALLSDNACCCVVFGMPYHLHGDTGDKARQVEQLAVDLAKRITLPIFCWDERWTTVRAHQTLQELGESPSRNKARVDRMAAAFILQAFLDRIAAVRSHR